MASLKIARSALVRNPVPVEVTDLPRASRSPACPKRRMRACPTTHLTPGQYLRLLTFVADEGGSATLDAISRALPGVLQPISAVFDLCDSGDLNVDWGVAFDGDMRVWRVDR